MLRVWSGFPGACFPSFRMSASTGGQLFPQLGHSARRPQAFRCVTTSSGAFDLGPDVACTWRRWQPTLVPHERCDLSARIMGCIVLRHGSRRPEAGGQQPTAGRGERRVGNGSAEIPPRSHHSGIFRLCVANWQHSKIFSPDFCPPREVVQAHLIVVRQRDECLHRRGAFSALVSPHRATFQPAQLRHDGHALHWLLFLPKLPQPIGELIPLQGSSPAQTAPWWPRVPGARWTGPRRDRRTGG